MVVSDGDNGGGDEGDDDGGDDCNDDDDGVNGEDDSSNACSHCLYLYQNCHLFHHRSLSSPYLNLTCIYS